MKKLFIVTLAWFLISGCGYIQLKPGTGLMINIAVRHSAEKIAKKADLDIQDTIDFCNMILSADGNVETLIDQGIEKWAKKDPLVGADLRDLKRMMVINHDFNVTEALMIVQTFKEALELRKE